jgi:hypothetical protein
MEVVSACGKRLGHDQGWALRGRLVHQRIAAMSDTRVAMAQRTLGGVLAIIGGLLLAVSAFLPWIRSTPGGMEADPTRAMDTVSGMDGGDGIFFLAGGVLIAALGLLTTLSRPKAAPILLILSGLAFGLFGLLEYNSIRDSIRPYAHNCCDMGGFAVGEGIWWIFAGAAATFLAGLILVGQRSLRAAWGKLQ